MNQKLVSTESSSRGEARNADAAVVVAEIGENRHEIIKHIYHEWDDALSKLDVERLLAFYAPDATLESPLVRHLLKTDRGVLRAGTSCGSSLTNSQGRSPRHESFIGRDILQTAKC